MERELLKGNTPSLILAVLRDGPLHGYGIAREIERRSDRVLRLNEGSLYPALRSMEADGLIAGEWRTGPEGRNRRVYALTPAGHAALAQRSRLWRTFSGAIDRVLNGEDHGGAEQTPAGSPRRLPRPEPAG